MHTLTLDSSAAYAVIELTDADLFTIENALTGIADVCERDAVELVKQNQSAIALALRQSAEVYRALAVKLAGA